MEATVSEERNVEPREIIDEIVSRGFDWEDLVRAYPIPALLLAALGGFVLGRSRGDDVLEALSAFAADQVSERVNEALGEEVV